MNNTTCIPQNCSLEFSCPTFVITFCGLMPGFGFIMTHLCFMGCHSIVKKFLIFVLIAWQKLPTKFNSWSFHLFSQHTRNLSCIDLLTVKNINNVSHMHLWNARPDSNFPFVIRSLSLISLLNFFLWHSLVAVMGRPLHCLSHNSTLPSSPSLHVLA